MSCIANSAEGCSICVTFVSSLQAFCARDEGLHWPFPDDHHHVLWTFTDRLPALPGLANSASKGCSWCAILNHVVATPRIRPDSYALENEEETITIKFNLVGDYQCQGPLGEITNICAGPKDDVWPKDNHPKIGPYTVSSWSMYVLNSDDFSPVSVNNIRNMRRAIDSCVRRHSSHCPGSDPGENPLRLLNVMDGNFVKLEDTESEKYNYAALSYCWGASDAMHVAQTTRANVKERLIGFPLAGLPKTLRDAVSVTRALEIRYIWIDALCIVQDCNTEWTREAQKMMQYYGNARVTIVPILSDSADSGMGMEGEASERPFSRKFPGLWRGKQSSDLILSDKPTGYRDKDLVSKSVWNSRGWTYQERLNSARILFVFDRSLTLECREGAWDTLTGWQSSNRGSLAPGRPYHLFLPISKEIVVKLRDGHYDWGAYYDWGFIVRNYTSRRLTHSTDRWFAFSGIAETYSRMTGHKIVAGLLKNRILEDMVSWAVPKSSPSSGGSASRKASPDPHDHTGVNIPSWSWLGADWCGREAGVMFDITQIGVLKNDWEPSSKVQSIVDESGQDGPIKVQVAGPALHKDALLSLLASFRSRTGSFFGGMPCPARGPGIAFFDHEYDDASYGCSCTIQHPPHRKITHVVEHCKAYNIIGALSPPASALLVGVASLSWEGRLHWHFIFIQPTDSQPIEPGGLCHYRRIGTMHIRDEEIGHEVKMELCQKEPDRIILV